MPATATNEAFDLRINGTNYVVQETPCDGPGRRFVLAEDTGGGWAELRRVFIPDASALSTHWPDCTCNDGIGRCEHIEAIEATFKGESS